MKSSVITSRLREKAASRPPATPEKREGPPHLVVKAGAGTGKTTTLIGGLQGMRGMVPSDASGRPLTPSPQQQAIWDAMSQSRDARTVAFCAFNKPIATELQTRVPPGAVAMTMHSLGNKVVSRAFGYCRLDTNRVAKIVEEILEQPIEEIRRTSFAVLKATEDLTRMVKMNLIPTDVVDPGDQEHVDELLQDLADYYEINFEPEEDTGGRGRYQRRRPVASADSEQIKRQVFDLVPQVIARCKEVARDRTIDFNDMVWLPPALGLVVERYDLLLVDECLPGWTPVMLGDGRSMTIKEIVETEEPVTVRSYDTTTGMPRNCQVVGRQRILNQKPLVKVRVKHCHRTGTNRKHNFVICTTDHKVWTVNRGWVQAGELKLGDNVIVETEARTSQRGKITKSGREHLAELQAGNKRGFGSKGGDPTNFNSVKGGNGRSAPLAERVLLEALEVALGPGWGPQTVKTGDAPQFGRGDKPSHYKLDLANEELRIAIEVDGSCHRGREEADRKKDKFLEEEGWRVLRVSNRRAIQEAAAVVGEVAALQMGGGDCPRPAKVVSVDPVVIRDSYVYDITVEDCHNFYANGILVHNCQDLNRCQQALAKMSGRRLVFCGDDKQCQPAGTLVRLAATPGNPWHPRVEGRLVPIESLSVGDIVQGYCPKDGRYYENRVVQKIASRPYEGDLIEVETDDGAVSRYTPDHRCYATFGPLRNSFVVYLMHRGNQFRVGCCQLNYKESGNGLTHRLRTEEGDGAWILEVFADKREARLREMEISYTYNIPQELFPTDKVDQGYILDREGAERFWKTVGDNSKVGSALLVKYGLELNRPVAVPDNYYQQSFKRPALFAACNLVSGMQVLKGDTWTTIQVRRVAYSGRVYSLSVSHDELYTADGIVTHNSIYGFAGADCDSLPRLTEELSRTPRGVVTLPLMQSRRCAKAVVREAQKYAPDFDYFEDNPEGLVTTLPFSGDWHDQVRDGDYLLCRTNAPLVSAFFRFISAGRRASILGRDLGANLVRFVRKLKADNVPDLLGKADRWLEAEEKAEMGRKFPREDRLASLQDKVACLAVFCQGEADVEGVVGRMEQAFTDNRESPGIRLSSVHKAKGLEAQRVFLMLPKGAGIPHPMAKTPWAREQENHILYIAITRARETFTYVRDNA